MKKQPIVSIIVPVYNAEQYLRQCMQSLVNQTMLEIEIICINDGSTDSSLEILEEYAKEDERVLVVDKENEGVAMARNVGVAKASGEYVMFVDSDDWIDTNTCFCAVRVLEDNCADVVLWPYVREFGDVSSKKEIFNAKEKVFVATSNKNDLHRRFVGLIDEELKHPENADALCPVWGKLYRKNIIEETEAKFVDLKEIGTYEDGLFNLYVWRNVKKAVYVNESFYHYRKTLAEKITTVYNPRLFQQWAHLFEMMQAYIEKNALPEEYRTALNNRVVMSTLGLGLNILRCQESTRKKMNMLKDIIINEKYKVAYQKFDMKYLPIHWKVFYGVAKYKQNIVLYILLCLIKKIIER